MNLKRNRKSLTLMWLSIISFACVRAFFRFYFLFSFRLTILLFTVETNNCAPYIKPKIVCTKLMPTMEQSQND